AFHEKDRPQSVVEWRRELTAARPDAIARIPKAQVPASSVSHSTNSAPAPLLPATREPRGTRPAAQQTEQPQHPRRPAPMKWPTLAALLMATAGVSVGTTWYLRPGASPILVDPIPAKSHPSDPVADSGQGTAPKSNGDIPPPKPTPPAPPPPAPLPP